MKEVRNEELNNEVVEEVSYDLTVKDRMINFVEDHKFMIGTFLGVIGTLTIGAMIRALGGSDDEADDVVATYEVGDDFIQVSEF